MKEEKIDSEISVWCDEDDQGEAKPEIPTVPLSTYRFGCIVCAILGCILGWYVAVIC